MPSGLVRAYLEMLPSLHSERQLAGIEAAAVPHMTVLARSDVLRGHSRAVGPSEPAQKATPADLAAMGIRVKEVPARG